MMEVADGIFEAIAKFIDDWEDIKEAEFNRRHYTHGRKTWLGILHGAKFTRIVEVNPDNYGQSPVPTSAMAFIDLATGDIYMPSSWAKPAKHVRGNLFSPSGGAEAIGPGGWGIRTLR